MNSIPQTDVFSSSIDRDGENHINNLILSMQKNPAKLQQLAIDASYLLSNSEERLSQQKNTGFFERIMGAFTGKPNELIKQNQFDIIEMQKYAWYYLKELQRQNLIIGKSIAIIRNNLVVMNDAIIETRLFLEEAIDKINDRLIKVENKAELQDWRVAKDAESRKFKKLPKTIKILCITYDFIKNNYNYIHNYSDINYIFSSLDNLGVDLDEEISLNDFIYHLIDDICAWGGQEKYTDLIKLDLDEHSISNNYIQDNISGTSVNALYFLDNNFSRVIDLLSMNDDNNYNEELISKFFGGEFGHLSEIYTIEQLVFEIIGGCLTAIDLFKEQNHLIKNSEDVLKDYKNDVGKNTLEAILSLPEITTHSWLIKQNREKSLRYLKVLSLCCDINNDNSVLFFEKLTEIADVRDEFHRILDNTAENTHLIYNKSFLEEFLQSDNDKYTLILDMMYMFTLSEMDLENKFIVTLVSNTKPSNFREVYSTLLDIIRNDEESVVINAIAKLNQFSDAWKNIIVYRELEFNDYFNILITKLNNNHSIDLRLRLFKLSFRNFKECWSSGDEGWPARKIIELSRSSLLSDLNKEKNNAVKLLENFYSDLHKVNALCNKFGLQCIKFQEHLSNDDYQLDNSVTNDSWPSQFEGCQEKIESILSVMDDTCTLAIEQLELFGKGKFDVSIIKTREIEKKEREEKLRLEKLSKLNATIEVNSVEKKISIYWEELSDYPFDLDNIRDVVSNGESWLVLDYSKNLYQSQNACEWQKIALPIENISEIRYVDGIWFAMTYNNDFTFSENLSEWHLGQKPKVLEDNKYSATDDLMKFGDKWLWRITKRQEYTYTEKGLIWDTEKTGNYDKSVFYITDSLSCSWKEWNNSPYLPSGVVIKKAAIIPKSQLVMVFCAFDSWYLQDKKLEEKSNYAMYFNGSDWKRADWNDNNIKYIDRHLYFKEHLNKYYCYANGNILISEKGYIWDELLSNYYITEAPRCGSLYLFTSNSNKLYFSVDLSEYKELILEDGNWKHLTPNNDKILSVYSKDRHESFLKIGHIVLE